MTTLPRGFTTRPATMDDLDAVVDVMRSTAVIEPSAGDTEADDVLQVWRGSQFDLAQHTLCVVSPEGLIVGYEEVARIGEGGQAHADGYVHPEYTGRGVGTTLLRWSEARVRELMTVPEVQIRAGMSGNDKAAHVMFANEGYEPIRNFQRMEIEFAAAPAAAVMPEGIEVRTFVLGQDERTTHLAQTESFADHWGSLPLPFEEWVSTRVGGEHFDPTLWFLAFEGQEIAGIALCRKRGEIGWVNTLGVRRPWRKRGLGLALLQHSFAELYQRGFTTVGLGVDSSSLTGATRLYERAGMRMTEQFVIFGKTVRK